MDMLDELAELEKKATPGEWAGKPRRLMIGITPGPMMSYLYGNKHSQEGFVITLGSERIADHQFVAALRNNALELIRLARAGRKLEGGTVYFCDDCEGVYESPSDYITSRGLVLGETFELMECVSFSMKEYRVLDDHDYEAIDAAMSASGDKNV